MIAEKRPDLLYAYIGMGQLIDARANERVGFAWTLAQARKDRNQQAIRELEALIPYAGPGPLDVAAMGVERRWSIRYGALAAGRHDADFYFHVPRLSPDYTPADRKAWDEGSAFTIATMWPQLADLDFMSVTRLKVPIILFLGRHDYTTPAELADAWLKRLHAPRKRAIWLEHSAHLMMLEEPGRVFAGLIREALPLAK
jgi:pimeloyl-ACP methyl ester carboxylesterase